MGPAPVCGGNGVAEGRDEEKGKEGVRLDSVNNGTQLGLRELKWMVGSNTGNGYLGDDLV